jgi:2,3-diketo-5-methylthio-1-phosphopentane phosphatase
MPPRVPLIVVLDFDGTVTLKDIGDEVCDHFAPPAWRDIDARWVRGELSLPEAQRLMWALARAERAQAIAYAREVGVLRPGLDQLIERVAGAGGELWLASGGFDFYIEALLDGRLPCFARAYFNRARFDQNRIEVSFPHSELACTRCAVCKGAVCDQARARAERVIFVGDGASDRCAVGRADEIFAVRSSHLAEHLASGGSKFVAFDRLDELTW